MKKIIFFLSCLSVFMASTSCRDQITLREDEPQYITIRLGTSGDGQTKSSSTADLYGITVYYDSARNGSPDTPYAYGLFDNKEDMTITLLSGYTYSFSCRLVKDGKTVLYYGQYGGNTFSGYAKPFQTSSSPSTQLTNAFVYGTEYMSGLSSGTATVKSSANGYEDVPMASLKMYYGSVSKYTPVVGGTVEIPLKTTVFGLRVIVDKVSGGSLSATCTADTKTLFNGTATTKLLDSGAAIFSFPYSGYYSMEATVNWSFTSSVFDQWNQSGSQSITLKRNTLTTVTVSYTPDNATGGISIDEEPMGEDNNINLFVNSDGLIDVYVDPIEGDD